jgi:hypothetical protein
MFHGYRRDLPPNETEQRDQTEKDKEPWRGSENSIRLKWSTEAQHGHTKRKQEVGTKQAEG